MENTTWPLRFISKRKGTAQQLISAHFNISKCVKLNGICVIVAYEFRLFISLFTIIIKMLNLCAFPRKTKLKLIGVTFELKRLHLPSVTLFYLEHDDKSTFYLKNVEKYISGRTRCQIFTYFLRAIIFSSSKNISYIC